MPSDSEVFDAWFKSMSGELRTAYDTLLSSASTVPLLDLCTFDDFVLFCYDFSSGRHPAC
jgi:hypothetical protein